MEENNEILLVIVIWRGSFIVMFLFSFLTFMLMLLVSNFENYLSFKKLVMINLN